MVVPTTQRQYYNTTRKVSSLAAYAGAIKKGAEAWGDLFDAQQKLRISTSLDEANRNISAEFARVSPQYDNNPENPELKQYMDDYRKQQYEIAKENIQPMYHGQFDVIAKENDKKYDFKFNDWILRQNQQNASDDVKKKSQALVDRAYYLALTGDLYSAKEEYDNGIGLIKDVSTPILGERETQARLTDLDEKYKEALLSGMLEYNPVALLSLVNNKENEFDDKLVTKYKKMATNRIEHLNNLKLDREIIDTANLEKNILDMSYKKNLTMQEIQDNMPENASEDFKKMILRINGYSTKEPKKEKSKGTTKVAKEKISPLQKAKVYQDFQDKLVFLTSNPDTTLKDFQDFNNEVAKSVSDGVLSLSDGKQFIGDIAVPTMNKWQSYLKQYGDNPWFGSAYGYDKLQEWITKSVLGKNPNKNNYRHNMREYEDIMASRARISSEIYRQYNEELLNVCRSKGLNDVSDLLTMDDRDKENILNAAVGLVMARYARDKFSSLRDTTSNPTYVLQGGKLTQVANNPEDKGTGTQLNETRIVQVGKRTNGDHVIERFAKFSDGSIRPISLDEYNKYKGL